MISVRGLFIASWITLAVASAISNDGIEEVNGNKIPQENRTDLHKLIRKSWGWLNKPTPNSGYGPKPTPNSGYGYGYNGSAQKTPTTSPTNSPTTSPTQKDNYLYDLPHDDNIPVNLCGKELRADGAQCLNSSNCKKKQCMKVVRGHICNDQNYDRLFFIESVASTGFTECTEKCGNHPTCRAIIVDNINDGCHLYSKECTNFFPHEQYITATLVIPGTDFPNLNCYSDYYIENQCVCVSGDDCGVHGVCHKNRCMKVVEGYYNGKPSSAEKGYLGYVEATSFTKCMEQCGTHPTCLTAQLDGHNNCYLYAKKCTKFTKQANYDLATLKLPGTVFPCSSGADCDSNYCNKGQCIPCSSGDDCDSNYPNCNKGQCEKKIGVECISGDDCDSGYCNKNKCMKVYEGKCCWHPSPGQINYNGKTLDQCVDLCTESSTCVRVNHYGHGGKENCKIYDGYCHQRINCGQVTLVDSLACSDGADCDSGYCNKGQCMKVVDNHRCDDGVDSHEYIISFSDIKTLTKCMEKCVNQYNCRYLYLNKHGCILFAEPCENKFTHDLGVTTATAEYDNDVQ